jgi:hypothetical protein
MIKESAKFNYSCGRERKERLKSELDEEKLQLKDKFRKIET